MDKISVDEHRQTVVTAYKLVSADVNCMEAPIGMSPLVFQPPSTV